MRKIKLYLFLLVTVISHIAYSQNCPQTSEVQLCNTLYNHAETIIDAERTAAEAECEAAYEADVAEAVAEWEADGEQDPADLENAINALNIALAQCFDDAFNSWVDGHIQNVDNWNACLCSSDCPDYCF